VKQVPPHLNPKHLKSKTARLELSESHTVRFQKLDKIESQHHPPMPQRHSLTTPQCIFNLMGTWLCLLFLKAANGSWTIVAILAIVAIGSHLQADAAGGGDDGPVKTDEQIKAFRLGTLDMQSLRC